MNYKYVFWDFNGTLIDDVGNALACVNDMLKRKNRKPITLDQYYTYVETPIVGFYRHILPPEELDFEEISRDYHKDYQTHLDITFLAEGATHLLERLKTDGVKQYIITAISQEEVEALTKKYGIYDYFEKILGADNNLAESKLQRAKEFFDTLAVDPSQAILIGDTLHDLETASALGIDCILVNYGHQGKRLLSENNAFSVDTLKDVESILFDTRFIDLHTHSTSSDGSDTPQELVQKAKEAGLSAIALTDHDSVEGIAAAQKEAEKIGIEFIPGIEFSIAGKKQCHIVGLYIDPENPRLLEVSNTLRSNRTGRMAQICRNLQNMGFDITFEECEKLAGEDFIGRAHIGKMLVDKGYCSSIDEAFNKYIGPNGPAYVGKAPFPPEEAIKAIRDAGGVAFLAHLHLTSDSTDELDDMLKRFKEAGLNGIEGYYSTYTYEHVKAFRTLAVKHSLAFSGGSDYHGEMKPHISLGKGLGKLNIPYFVLQNIKNIHNSQN